MSDSERSGYLPPNTPTIAYLEPTLRCNLRCVHCYVEKGIPGERDELSRGEIGEVLTHLAAMGTLVLVFTGGEVFLRSDAVDIMRNARRLGFAVIVLTNGTLVTPLLAAQLHDIAVLGMEVSVHGGAAPVHDAITGVAGSFDKAVEAISLIRRAGIDVKLKCSLVRGMNEDYEPVIALAERLGVKWKMGPLVFPSRDGNRPLGGLQIAEEAAERVTRDPRMTSPRRLTRQSRLELPEGVLCGAGLSTLLVSSNGDVFPCVSLKVKAGTVRRQPIGEIWREAGVFRQLRGWRSRDLAECTPCDLKSVCPRCCALAYGQTGSLLGCSPSARELAKVRMKVKQEESAESTVAVSCQV